MYCVGEDESVSIFKKVSFCIGDPELFVRSRVIVPDLAQRWKIPFLRYHNIILLQK
jgi:hypothetical protein